MWNNEVDASPSEEQWHHRRLQLGDAEDDYDPAPDISSTGMAVAAVPILIVALLSLYLRLGNVYTLLLASVRCVCQLMLLGLILYPVFRNNQPYVVFPYILVMITFATREASVKPRHRYNRMYVHIFRGMAFGLTISFSMLSAFVLRPDPWWDARVMIPVCGMMLGSCVNCLSLGIDRLLLGLSDSGGKGSPTLLTYLACGSTKWESSLPFVRLAIETGLTPNLNQMSVMGLVSIPGMMTGQILGGTPPLIAAKYQIVIMFFVVSNSTIVLFTVIAQAVFLRLFDKGHNFRCMEVSKRKGGKPRDVLMALAHGLFGLATRGKGWVQAKVPGGGLPTSAEGSPSMDDDYDEERDDQFENETVGGVASNGAPPSQPGTFRRASSENEEGDDDVDGPREVLLALSNGNIGYNRNRNHKQDHPPLLSNLNQTLRSGEILILTGPSGCGKSTFLRALALMEPWGADSILQLKGKDLSEVGETTWRSEICYVRQGGGQGLTGTPSTLLSDLCALKVQSSRLPTVSSGAEGNADDSKNERSATRAASLRLRSNLASVGLDPLVMSNRKWDDMSGGESQRAYLSVLLALRPSALLLDEPTSACDGPSALRVENALLDSGLSCVWVTHDPCQVERLKVHARTRVESYRKCAVEEEV